MNRRALLAGIAVTGVISGCVATENIPGQGGDSEANEGDEPVDSMTLRLDSVDEHLESLAFEVELIADQLSSTEMPLMDIRVENTDDSSVEWEDTETKFAFGGVNSSTPPGLLTSTESKMHNAGELTSDDGCLRSIGVTLDSITYNTSLSPGQSIDQRYAIAAHKDHVDDNLCPRPDTYRMESTYGDEGVWGFNVSLE